MYSFCFENKFNITTSTRQDNNLSGNLSGNKDFDNFNKIIYFSYVHSQDITRTISFILNIKIWKKAMHSNLGFNKFEA